METARVMSEGRITVPLDVRLRLGLIEGSLLRFIEQGNGFLVVNENRGEEESEKELIEMAVKNGWSEEFVKALLAFGDTPDETFIEHEDIPWTEREAIF